MRHLRLCLALILCAWSRAVWADVQHPKLVVFLAVDQMHADYYGWYGARWTRGLKRLFAKGAWFEHAAYPYLNTLTCAGHATLGTGAYPHTHGLILNAWYDRNAKATVECTQDGGAPLVPYGGGNSSASGGDSAHNLLVPALPDEMRDQLAPKPRVVALSFKARSAVGLGGHHPDVVVWFQGGRWVTSRAFATAPVPWVQAFVSAHPVEALLSRPWTRLLPAASYSNDDDLPGERPPAGWSATFPHAFSPGNPGIKLWGASPGPDEYLGQLAAAAVEQMRLGGGPSTDYLAVSFSMLDLVGHAFGPKSHEVQDTLARLDIVIGALLDTLDARVGADKYVLALSADHGVAPVPEQARRDGLDAGRLLGAELKKKTDEAIAGELGQGSYVASVENHEIYLLPGVPERLAGKAGAVERVQAALRALPGVADVLSADELARSTAASRPALRAAALSYYPGRSGDFVISAKPNWVFGSLGTNHGSTNPYDQHVPVVLYGAGIKPGKYPRPVSPADIAPTLASLVGVRLSKAEGTPLAEAVVPAAPKPSVEPAAHPRHRRKN